MSQSPIGNFEINEFKTSKTRHPSSGVFVKRFGYSEKWSAMEDFTGKKALVKDITTLYCSPRRYRLRIYGLKINPRVNNMTLELCFLNSNITMLGIVSKFKSVKNAYYEAIFYFDPTLTRLPKFSFNQTTSDVSRPTEYFYQFCICVDGRSVFKSHGFSIKRPKGYWKPSAKPKIEIHNHYWNGVPWNYRYPGFMSRSCYHPPPFNPSLKLAPIRNRNVGSAK
jgi:hypothetical protein